MCLWLWSYVFWRCVCVCVFICVIESPSIYLFVSFKGLGTRVCGIYGVCVFRVLGGWSLVTIGRIKGVSMFEEGEYGGLVYLHLKVYLILRALIDNVNLSLRSYGPRGMNVFWKDSFFEAYETCYMEGPWKKNNV